MAVTITATEIVAKTSYAFAGRKITPTDHLAAVEGLLPTATAVIEKYAPTAPSSVQGVAVTRYVGWWLEARFGSFASNQVKAPPQSLGPAFRNCGAQAMLSAWKVRRAAAV